MRLEFAFLADAATMLPNGNFDVIAGGFDVVTGPNFPATKFTLVFVARIAFEPRECNKQYEFLGEITDREGKPIFPELRGTMTPGPNPRHIDREGWITLALSCQGVAFPTPGDYFFWLKIDGQPVGKVMIEAVQEGKST